MTRAPPISRTLEFKPETVWMVNSVQSRAAARSSVPSRWRSTARARNGVIHHGARHRRRVKRRPCLTASFRLGRTALAVCLSLLVVMFSVQVKLACSSSTSGPHPKVLAATAWPGETSEMVMQGVSAAGTTCNLIFLFFWQLRSRVS